MSSLDSIYQELIMDHSRHPQGKGLAQAFDGESFQVNPTCGDQIRLRVNLAPQGTGTTRCRSICGAGDPGPAEATLARVSWDGKGCAISQASASIMTELVAGLDLAEVRRLDELFGQLMRSRGAGIDEAAEEALGDAVALSGVSRYPMRVKCALLGWMALRDATTKALAGDSSPATAPEGI
ncbi:MAG: SUF system NifU family Fe-S cluster assembly protein [Bifidobacteriaceae bacterium]|jgi:nitrogen fixation NifU-like protein|nr:SUF system NifU family Fe-S cluster assembly protein [Bifidobacteriaceae bacterium]